MNNKLQIQYALATYILFGLMPIFWKFLNSVPAMDILANRIIWSSIFLTMTLMLSRQWKLPSKRELVASLASGTLLLVNWGTFVYAIGIGKILECSLGYFMYPLTNALLGYIFFKESISKIPLFFFISAVLYLCYAESALPIIPLILSFSLSTYGLIRKKFAFQALQGLWLETVIMLPVAIAYLLYMQFDFFTYSSSLQLGLIETGIMTTVPLVFLLKALKDMSLTLLGIIQYVNPSLQFLLAIFLFQEELSMSKLCAFILIWIGIGSYFLTRTKS